ncbi:capsid protein [Vombatid gammaherpesvirus 1]|uniref:Capsid protein n=1 Tax=Vombatid gammaherpesvirus 1 TaxID=2052651 RepID=A0A3Q8J4G4_9GAMA|nr:capsid protein [Vombatid gammaherpesvirus 1]AZB49164.1 capsid protein [Vombatid gammaherpesvirus 1]
MPIAKMPTTCPETTYAPELTETTEPSTRPPSPRLEDKIELDFPESTIPERLKEIPKGNQSDTEYKRTRRLYLIYILASRCFEELMSKKTGIIRKQHYADMLQSKQNTTPHLSSKRGIPSSSRTSGHLFFPTSLSAVPSDLQTGSSSSSLTTSFPPLPEDSTFPEDESDLIPTGPKPKPKKK